VTPALDLVDEVLAGKRHALARLLTWIENDSPQGQALLDRLFTHTGRAYLIGVTGSPGSGKSSLVNQIARLLRAPVDGSQPRSVAIVAVDPTSPFTGGAVLGDRVRMRDLSGDPGVFIRSMASRGALGGLARTTSGFVQALDAAGFEVILIETVGAGQAEVDIARLAHTTLVVEAPGMGDDIQAIKAGILEIADIIVINKADRPGVENTERALRAMLEFSRPQRKHPPVGHFPLPAAEEPEEGWRPPLLLTVATTGEGVAELVQAIQLHADYLRVSGERRERERVRLQTELDRQIHEQLYDRWKQNLSPQRYHEALAALVERRLSLSQAANLLINTEDDTHPRGSA
jgi:LAO/AO transport system kinase